MTSNLSIVYRKCKKDGGSLVFENGKRFEIEIKESEFYIDEKHGGDIFDGLDDDNMEKSDLYNIEKNTKYHEIGKVINLNARANYMWDEMDMRDLKKYIFKIAEVPVESQYLESIDEYGELSSTCHYYKYIDPSLRNIKIRPRIDSIISEDNGGEESILEGVDMDYELHYSRSSFYVKESYKKIRTFLQRGSSVIYLYDLRELLDCVTEGSYFPLLNKIRDVDNLNIFYHGFVEKFYPLIQINNVSLFLKEKSLSSVYSFLNTKDTNYKNNIIKYINSKSKKNSKLLEGKGSEIQYIKLAYKKTNTNTGIHILKLYNSLDLDEKIVKIKAYISHKNLLLEKIKPYELESSKRTRLPESVKKDIKSHGISYLTIYYSRKSTSSRHSEITIFSNGDITCLAVNDNLYQNTSDVKKDFVNTSLKKIYEWLLTHLNEDAELYFNYSVIRRFCVVESVGVQQVINVQPDFNSYSDVISIFRDLEILDEFKTSSSEGSKESIILFSSRRQRATLKMSLNDFHDYIEHKISGLPEFFSRQNIQINFRLNDILIHYNNININDYPSYFNLCNVAIDIYSDIRKGSKANEEFYSASSKRIKMLKQTDHLLFNTDSIDKENKYSRLCQSKQQPLIISKQEANSKKYKSKAVKFWNFTKGAPEFYMCDSDKYPYLKFITGNHPKNFCLPCCKKKMVDSSEDSASTYKDRHNVCMEKYIYEKKANHVENNTNRYISLYSCKLELEENRLMKLSPTLKKLLRSQKETTLFIYGVSPFSNIIESYVLKILSIHRFNNSDSSVDVLLSIIKILEERNDLIYQLADGQLFANFSSSDELIEFLYSCAEGGVKINSWGEWVRWIDWDSVFIEILNLFSDTAIIEIIETDDNSVNDSRADINFSRDLVDKKEYIVVFKRATASGETVRYPLTEINLSEFYTDYAIQRVSFSSDSRIVKSIKSVISIAHKETSSSFVLDINWLAKFSNSSNISIDCLFVNYLKNVYAVSASVKGRKILIHTEYINSLKAKEILRKEKVETKENIDRMDCDDCYIKGVLEFCKMFNLSITTVFTEEENAVAGIASYEKSDYFFRLDKKGTLKDISNYKVIRLSESLDKINTGSKVENVMESVYQVNLYDILLLHVNNKLSKKVNYYMRDTIKSIFIENVYGKDTAKELNMCFELLQKTVTADDAHRIIYGFANSFKENSAKSTKISLDNAVLESLVFLSLDRFEFDNRLDNINLTSVKEFLNDIVTIENANVDMDFDMNFGVCSKRDSYYCKGGKYIIPQSEYTEILDVLVKDLSNDYKKKYILQYNDIHIKNSGLESGLYIKQHKNSNTLIYDL